MLAIVTHYNEPMTEPEKGVASAFFFGLSSENFLASENLCFSLNQNNAMAGKTVMQRM